MLVRLALRYVPDMATAEDVTQETWLHVLRGLSRFEFRSSTCHFCCFLLPLILAITIVHVLSDGPPLFDFSLFGLLPLSRVGLEAGLLVAFRLAAMGIALIMFSMTTDPFDWGMAMYLSGLSYKVAFMFAFVMRFFPLLQEELIVIRNALTACAYHAIGSRNS